MLAMTGDLSRPAAADDDRPWLIAHRGASREAPENTLAAFRLAWEQNADGIEGDFHLTRDGHIVCIHDRTTKRYCDVDLNVAESTLAELRKLDVGRWKDARYAGERIPTLDEVLAILPPGKRFFIEIKCGPEIIPPLKHSLLAAKTDLRRINIIAFREDVIIAAKDALPDVTACWLSGYKQNEQTGEWSPTIDEVLTSLKRCGADGLGTQSEPQVVDEAFVSAIRKAGYQLHTWTVDSPDQARTWRSLGLDSITTNRPGFLREALTP